MPYELLHIPLMLPVFALVLARLSGLMLTAPLFSGQAIPRRVKVGFTFSMAWLMYPMVAAQAPADLPMSIMIEGMAGELLIGVTLGLALATLFSGVQMGGLMAAQQSGIALGQAFDPTLNEQSTVVGQMYAIVVFLVFMISGGHRALIIALLDTFSIIPPLSFSYSESLLMLLVDMITSAMVMALRLSGPVLIALSLLTLSMGLLSRTMPQLNILSVGFTLKAVVMLGVAGLAIVAGQQMVLKMIFDGLDRIRESMGLLA